MHAKLNPGRWCFYAISSCSLAFRAGWPAGGRQDLRKSERRSRFWSIDFLHLRQA
jgi:hypothetical protein